MNIRVLVDFALNSGEGIKQQEVVLSGLRCRGCRSPVRSTVALLRSGGHPLVTLIDDEFKLIKLTEGSDQQVGFFPAAYYNGLADTIDHSVHILADADPLFLAGGSRGRSS